MSADSTNDNIRRLPVVAVLGGGSDPLDHTVAARCRELGGLLARRGCHLLTGGGRGVMTEVASAFVAVADRAGISIGVLPGDAATGEPPEGYPNPFVEVAIRTHLPARGDRGETPASRNHLNVLTADAVIALPGGAGTASEVELAVGYGRPIIAFGRATGKRESPSDVPLVEALRELETWLDLVLGAPSG